MPNVIVNEEQALRLPLLTGWLERLLDIMFDDWQIANNHPYSIATDSWLLLNEWWASAPQSNLCWLTEKSERRRKKTNIHYRRMNVLLYLEHWIFNKLLVGDETLSYTYVGTVGSTNLKCHVSLIVKYIKTTI